MGRDRAQGSSGLLEVLVPTVGSGWDELEVGLVRVVDVEGDLAADFRLDGQFHEGKGVDVLDFDAGAQFCRSFGSDGDVCIDAKRAFFHVSVRDVEVEEDGADGHGVGGCFFR